MEEVSLQVQRREENLDEDIDQYKIVPDRDYENVGIPKDGSYDGEAGEELNSLWMDVQEDQYVVEIYTPIGAEEFVNLVTGMYSTDTEFEVHMLVEQQDGQIKDESATLNGEAGIEDLDQDYASDLGVALTNMRMRVRNSEINREYVWSEEHGVNSVDVAARQDDQDAIAEAWQALTGGSENWDSVIGEALE